MCCVVYGLCVRAIVESNLSSTLVGFILCVREREMSRDREMERESTRYMHVNQYE